MLKFLVNMLLFTILFLIAVAAFSSKGACITYDKQFEKVTRCFKIGKGL